MARRLVWSTEAIEDIESIASYIERDSLWYAKAVASKIVETAETIPDYPELGHVVPEIGESTIRERFVYSYRVIYRIEPERILVAAVIHGSRLLQPFAGRIEGGPKSNL
jgi:toxin ParE1/3/4